MTKTNNRTQAAIYVFSGTGVSSTDFESAEHVCLESTQPLPRMPVTQQEVRDANRFLDRLAIADLWSDTSQGDQS